MTIPYLRQVLEDGHCLLLPTETVYGLFAKALDEAAVNRVYELKKRPRDKAMNLNVATYDEILMFSKNQPPYLKTIYDTFLPGPLTLILQASQEVPRWINTGLETVGFRLPTHPITRQLIQECGPLIGPSANLSGQASGCSFKKIQASLAADLSGYADDAAIGGLDSTILDLSGKQPTIIRQGAITKDDLAHCIPILNSKNE